MSKAMLTAVSLNKILAGSKYDSLDTKQKLFLSMVEAVILYGSEV